MSAPGQSQFDLREAIRTQPMRRFQYSTILICFLLCMVDGFEILIMAFVAPHLSKDWGLDDVQVGYLLSAGLFGMAAGAFGLSPLADRFGRRRMTIACLGVITLGMGLSAMAQGPTELMVYRAFAGIGIGGIVASLNILVAENSSDAKRGLAMGIYGAGLPAGVALGGAISGVLIAQWNWRAAFVFGTVVTALLLLVVIRSMPESISYLVEKRPVRALEQYNAIARRLGYPTSSHLPPATATGATRSVRGGLFSGIVGRRTALLWLGYSCLMAAFYFANTWTPKLLTEETGNASTGTTAGVLINVGGVLGALVFAVLTTRMRPRVVAAGLMVLGALVYVAYSQGFHVLALGLALSVLVGVVANGGVASYYAISPTVYPAAVRGTGVGLMIGVGRLVSIVAPILTGYLLDGGWAPEDLYLLFALVIGAAGVLMAALDRTYRGRSEDPETPEGPAAPSSGVPSPAAERARDAGVPVS